MADVVHAQYTHLADETTSNLPGVLNTIPADTAYGVMSRPVGEMDLPRQFQCYYTPTDINSNSTEALVSLTPTDSFVTGTAATAFTVPAGMVFRPQMLIFGGRVASTTSPPNWGVARLRAVPSGSVSVTSPLIGSVHIRFRSVASTNMGHVDAFRFSRGMADLPAGAQFGISFDTATGTASRALWSICLVGYEF